MEASFRNQTSNISYSEFILLGFPGVLKHRSLLILPFLVIYLVVLMCNCPIIYQIWKERSLHSPMHILILSLLMVSVINDTVIIPKMLASFVGLDKISLNACLIQLFIISFNIVTESVIMLMMAFDRYVAICKPLYYHEIMSKHLPVLLSIAGFMRNCVVTCVIVIMISQLQFCKSNIILHFHCESIMLINLACGDISRVYSVGLLIRTTLTIFDISIISVSYLRVLYSAMKITSGGTRHKALHTCSTHLSVVILAYFFGIVSSILYRSGTAISYDIQNLGNAVHLFFTGFLNPVIYGLRIKEIKESLLKQWKRKCVQ
ncbi:olfactory receptor 52K1-like [Hyperolius riggenbachi]|uniref:olfactory receptor 52K1-like n=1 Tax=Hyperolius riggenbachi TaxID=752182 RepID=UPI0035A2A7EE